jgi:hypothetical protein
MYIYIYIYVCVCVCVKFHKFHLKHVIVRCFTIFRKCLSGRHLSPEVKIGILQENSIETYKCNNKIFNAIFKGRN